MNRVLTNNFGFHLLENIQAIDLDDVSMNEAVETFLSDDEIVDEESIEMEEIQDEYI